MLRTVKNGLSAPLVRSICPLLLEFANMTLKLKEKKKVDLKVSIYLIKKKLKKQLNILMIRWMNMLKNFIQIKSKKTMTYHYSHCLFIATYYEKRYLYH